MSDQKNIVLFGSGPGYAGLGITATGTRNIDPGTQFNNFFPATKGTDPIVNKNATVHDTLNYIGKLVKETLPETQRIAKYLKSFSGKQQTLVNDFYFFIQHYRYKLDKYGVEQVRTPARCWKDRAAGVDCDCFATSVSSILTNQGIDHYLKIIAINGNSYFQHIYVIVPKFKNATLADMRVRENYWVIDPVLNRFDEEAKKITKTDLLKMNGIPLQILNGVDAGAAGLGREFDALDQSLNGVEDMEGVGFGRFRAAMHAHVRNTHAKIKAQPSSVEAVYEPAALEGLYRRAEAAFHKDDETLLGELEQLSAIEDLALKPRFRENANAIHLHDDHLYGTAFGDIDEQMTGAYLGLGKKGGKSGGTSKKAKKANKKVKKAGPLTKIKNAVKNAKKITKKGVAKGAIKKGLKKIAKGVVKYNPVSLAARAGFLTAMRINFNKIAEKLYWGYFSQAEATAKGINADYYAKCVELLAKAKAVFVGKLKGDESALKKAIMNGRAAKKIASQLKKRGMRGLGELFGLNGPGLGVVTEATVTAALAFLTPLGVLAAKLFKGKKSGLEASKKHGKKSKKNKDGSPVTDSTENENGSESQGPSDDHTENMNETIDETSNPSDTTNENDGSVEAADKANDEEPSEDKENFNPAANKGTPGGSDENDVPEKKEGESEADYQKRVEAAKKSKGGNGGTIAVVGLLAVAAAIALGSKKKPATEKKEGMNGLGNFSAKRETKNLQTKLEKQGVKMPHGYQVKKRKVKKIKTIKI